MPREGGVIRRYQTSIVECMDPPTWPQYRRKQPRRYCGQEETVAILGRQRADKGKEHPMKSNLRSIIASTSLLSLAAFGLAMLTPSSILAQGARHSAPASMHMQPLFAALPIDFIPSLGQEGPAAKFVARKGPLAVAFETNALHLYLQQPSPLSVGLTFEGASKQAQIVGEARRKTLYNYYVGAKSARWQSGVPAYGSIRYRGLYPGVDVRVKEANGRLEYDLVLAPHADLSQVVVRADGASHIATERDGSLVLETAAGPLRQALPKTWEQLPNGKTRPLACRFRRIDGQRYGFVAPGHDPAHRLVVDPGLEWGTYVGGSLGASVRTVAPVRDGSGDVIIAGLTTSPDFPLANGSFAFPAERLFVARLNAAGTALEWATFFGGSGSLGAGREFIWGRMAVDSSGGVVVVGDNELPDFPVTSGAFQTTKVAGIHAFVTRFNATGGLVFSTFLGGNGFDSAQAAAFDPAGNIIVAGTTESTDFPVTAGAFQTSFEGTDRSE